MNPYLLTITLFQHLLFPVLNGFLLIRLLLPSLPIHRSHGAALMQLAAGTVLGMGLSSVVYILLWFADLANARAVLAADILTFMFILLLFCVRRQRLASGSLESITAFAPVCPPESAPAPGRLVLLVTVTLVTAAALGHFGFKTMAMPYGDWDACTIWNFRARFLHLAHGNPSLVFHPFFEASHPDYPLLLSGFIARGWDLTGGMSPLVPIAAAFLFTTATAGLGAGALCRLRGALPAMTFAALLLGTPFFIHYGGSQYADIPVGGFILAAAAFLVLHDADPAHDAPWLVLAGFAASLAGWTKNEGSTFLFFLGGALVFVTLLRTRSWRLTFRRGLFFAIGAVPVFLLAAAFKHVYNTPNEIFLYQTREELLRHLHDPARYRLVVTTVLKTLVGFGWWWAFCVPVVLALAPFLCGIRRRFAGAPAAAAVLLALAAQFALCCAVYVITPYDPAWHMRTSLDRIICQLYPATLFLYFLWLRLTPEPVPTGGTRAD